MRNERPTYEPEMTVPREVMAHQRRNQVRPLFFSITSVSFYFPLSFSLSLYLSVTFRFLTFNILPSLSYIEILHTYISTYRRASVFQSGRSSRGLSRANNTRLYVHTGKRAVREPTASRETSFLFDLSHIHTHTACMRARIDNK